MNTPTPGIAFGNPDDSRNRRALKALTDLHTATLDALAGFETMVEKAEPEFRPVALQFRDLHANHAMELAELITHAGGAVDRDGSLMGTINKVVVSARAFFDEIDADVMQQIRSGEDHVLSKFDEAVESPVDASTDARVLAMRDEVKTLLSQTQDVA